MDTTNITAVVLAGGQSRRMLGQDKGLMLFNGKMLIAHVLTRLKPRLDNILISANDHLDEYRQLGLPVISDSIAGYPGPLAGIYSAMRAMTTEWLLTVPCDTPLLPDDYVARMLTTAASHPAQRAFVAYDGQRQQCGCCLLHKSLQSHLQQVLEDEQFAVYKFLAAQQALEVDFSDEHGCFINVNTPEQLADIQKQ